MSGRIASSGTPSVRSSRAPVIMASTSTISPESTVSTGGTDPS
jgi:hypothetical protein